jgi:hypothetical protein
VPTRILDTRTTTGGHLGPLRPGETVSVTDVATAGVPADAVAVVVNLTAVAPTGNGYLSAFPDAFSGTSTLNYGRFTRANLAVVTLNSSHGFNLYNSSGTVNALVDVVGYLGGTGADASFVSLPSPVRICDTRYGNGGHLGVLPGSSAMTIQSGELFGVPYDATSVWTNLTVVPPAGGYVTAYAAGTSRPAVSNLNFTHGRVIPNAAAVGLSTGAATAGQLSLFAAGTTNLIVDLFGYFE